MVDSWMFAEGCFIPKEKNSSTLNQFRTISLLSVEGEIFLSVVARRMTKYMLENKYIDLAVQSTRFPSLSRTTEISTRNCRLKASSRHHSCVKKNQTGGNAGANSSLGGADRESLCKKERKVGTSAGRVPRERMEIQLPSSRSWAQRLCRTVGGKSSSCTWYC